MSHLCDVKLEVSSLDDLEDACVANGHLELVRGAKTYKWYGTYVGDSPVPEGFTKESLGKCSHKIRIRKDSPHYQSGSYEVGVVETPGQPGKYTLLFDYWNGGYGLEKACGDRLCNLKTEYGIAKTRRVMKKKGFNINVRQNAQTGRKQVVCTRMSR